MGTIIHVTKHYISAEAFFFRKEQGLPASIDTILMYVKDYRLLPWCC
jgi:hypothetical protein